MDIEKLDREILAFIHDRIDRLGRDESGAYSYYQARADQAFGLSNYERALLPHLRDRARVFHVGIGFGTLGAALATQGVDVVGFESDRRRMEGAHELRSRLRVVERLELREGLYPQALREEDETSDATLLFTNFGAIPQPGVEEGIIATFPRFASVILDLRLFCRIRNEPGEREELAERLRLLGMGSRDLYTTGENLLRELTRE